MLDLVHRIKRNLPRLEELHLNDNPFEEQPEFTRYYEKVADMFDGRLKILNKNALSNKLKKLKVANDYNDRDNREEDRDENQDDKSDDFDDDEENGNQRVQVQTLIDSLEKSLKMPSQANKHLTNLKRIVQGLSLIEGNVFTESKDTLVSWSI